jgi:hypothetical protein
MSEAALPGTRHPTAGPLRHGPQADDSFDFPALSRLRRVSYRLSYQFSARERVKAR